MLPTDRYLEPKTILQGRYLIVRLIGQGGMGAVYEAADRRLGSTVALKATFFRDEPLRKAFESEARLLARLRHPELPKVIDHFAEGGGQFLVMEFIPGPDLAAVLQHRGSPFAPGEVLRWGDQLLGTLEYLHAQQPPVIHRDIKPQNLKLGARGEVILLDFGLAKSMPAPLSGVNSGRSVVGYTPNYGPLEQINRTGTDQRADLYSLAATLYHLMSGVMPPDAMARAAALVGGQPDPLRPADEMTPSVPAAVAAVLTQVLALNRDQRPASAEVMRRALLQASQSLTAGDYATVRSLPTPADTPTQLTGQVASVAAAAPRQVPVRASVDTAPSVVTPTTPPDRQDRPQRPWLWLGGAALLLLVSVLGITSGLNFLSFTRPPGPPGPQNKIHNFKAEDVSETELRVSVDYTYAGDRGVDGIFLAAYPLQKDGSQVPGLNSRPAPVNKGEGRATLKIQTDARSGSYASTAVKVCLAGADGEQFACEAFPFTKTWSVPGARRPPRNDTPPPQREEPRRDEPKPFQPVNDLRNFRAASISDSVLEVTVDYTYTGDRGASRVLMAAYAQQSDGSRGPHTGFQPGLVNEGQGSATVRLVLRAGRGSYTSSAVQVCMYVYEGGVQGFHCETFQYEKTWRAGPPPGAPRPEPPHPAPQPSGVTSIRNFRALDLSPTELLIKVDYSYGGEWRPGGVAMSAQALQSDGSPLPYARRPLYVLQASEGTATVRIEKRPGNGPYASAMVRVCIHVRRTGPVSSAGIGGAAGQSISAQPRPQSGPCQTFRYTKSWE